MTAIAQFIKSITKANSKAVLIFLVFSMLFIGNIYAQNGSDSINNTNATMALINSKRHDAAQYPYQFRLFNGIKYVEYPPGDYKGTAFFGEEGFHHANLHYDGADFYDIPILYDIYREMIVVAQPVDTSNIILINNKLDRFSIDNHLFVRIDKDKSNNSLKDGFYELLYNGKSALVKKIDKYRVDEKVELHLQMTYKDRVFYYMLKNNIYNQVSNEKTVLLLLKDQKKELEKFIKTNKIFFTAENKESAMLKVAAYYDQLNK